MKKIVIAILVMMLFVSCSGDSNSTYITSCEITDSSLIGQWNRGSVSYTKYYVGDVLYESSYSLTTSAYVLNFVQLDGDTFDYLYFTWRDVDDEGLLYSYSNQYFCNQVSESTLQLYDLSLNDVGTIIYNINNDGELVISGGSFNVAVGTYEAASY